MENLNGNRLATVVLTAKHWLTPGILEFRITRPAGFSFIPGQFLRFLMDGYQRDYTPVSKTDATTIDCCTAVLNKGRFSSDILKADLGVALQISGPHGHFVFQGTVNPAVFVATGTGVAPFMAFSRAGVSDALLLHGVGSPAELIYRNSLQSGLREYVPCISQPFKKDVGLANAYSGRVTQYLEAQLKPGTYDFYLCGRRNMIRDATAIIDQQFDDSRLFIETYD